MKIFLDVIGCRLNQSEIEEFANHFRALGHQIVSEPDGADVAIVNTCAVTTKAAADSRKQLRRAGREGAQAVIATGCWATLAPQTAQELPGVTKVYVNQQKGSILADLLNKSPEEIATLSTIRQPLPGERARTRAFIKVQEGCDNGCTYCLTRVARGRSRSVELSHIHKDIQAALDGGTKEIVLTGVQLGGWGRDFTEPKTLSTLLAAILVNHPIPRLRLSSIEPWEFDVAMLSLWRDERLCRHLHIPLQSGSERILGAMARPITVEAYKQLIEAVRTAIPGVAVTTDVIVGFPGEDEAGFEATRSLIKTVGFAGGHVFTYSPRPGTPAYQMEGQVPRQIAKARNAELRKVFKQTSWAYRDSLMGQDVDVLWEASYRQGQGQWQLTGLTDHYVRVISEAEVDLGNRITSVRLDAHHSDKEALFGRMDDWKQAPDQSESVENYTKSMFD